MTGPADIKRSSAQPITVLFALLPAITIPHLLELGYWRLDAELLLIGGASILVGIAIAPIERRLPVLGSLLIAISIYWFVDVYFDRIGFIAIVSIFGTLGILASRYAQDARRVILVFSCVWLAINLVQPSVRPLEPPLPPVGPANSKSSLPPIVHIILDEQMSPAVSPPLTPIGLEASAYFGDYVDRGFAVYARTPSTTSWTKFSLSQLVLVGSKSAPMRTLISRSGMDSYTVKENTYFENLRNLGYAFTVVQSSYLAFCDEKAIIPGDECHTYRMNDHGNSVTRLEANLVDRMMVALNALRFDYRNFGKTDRSLLGYFFLRKLTKELNRRVALSMPAAMLLVMDQLNGRLRNVERGRVYFAHLLLPHNPFVLDQHCALAHWKKWTAYNSFGKGWAWGDVEAAYWQQVICTHERVMKLIDELQQSEAGRDAVIFIHGDHGSRFAVGRPPNLDREDSEDMQMTYLAYKMPGKKPGVEMRRIGLQDAFAQTAAELMVQLKQLSAASAQYN